MKEGKREIFSESEWSQLTEQLCLSRREAQIIRLLCEGHKNYSAAQALGISPATVRTYLRRVYRKVHVNDRFELLCVLFHTARKGCPPKR